MDRSVIKGQRKYAEVVEIKSFGIILFLLSHVQLTIIKEGNTLLTFHLRCIFCHTSLSNIQVTCKL